MNKRRLQKSLLTPNHCYYFEYLLRCIASAIRKKLNLCRLIAKFPESLSKAGGCLKIFIRRVRGLSKVEGPLL